MNSVIFWMCAASIGGVFGVMLYSVATFHDVPNGCVRRRSVVSEVLWALVPVFIFIGAAMPIVGSVAATR